MTTQPPLSWCERDDQDCSVCSLSAHGLDCRGESITPALRLQRVRTGAHLTQAAAAKKCSIPLSTLKNWEYGTRKPTAYVLESVIDRLKADDLT